MFDDLISQLEKAILEMVGADQNHLACAAKKLSFMFTSERDVFFDQYFSDADLLDAYIAAFVLPNAVKVMQCLSQIDGAGSPRKNDDFHILDIGCGPATAILAASLFFSKNHPEKHMRFAGIEQNKAALLKAHELFQRIAPPHHSFESATFSIKSSSLDKILKAQQFDLVFVANMLNEFPSSAYEMCRELILNRLCDNGFLIIVEPALRNNTRDLMHLRDRLVADGIAIIHAPCLHHHSCPMLKTHVRDWCHFYIDWNCPKYLAELDLLSGMNHEYLKMSYLILKPKASDSDCAKEADLWRAVSSPLDSKGKREMFLCGACGEIKRVRRTNKDASDLNRDFDKACRGDIVRYSGPDRIHKQHPFSIIKPWQPSFFSVF